MGMIRNTEWIKALLEWFNPDVASNTIIWCVIAIFIIALFLSMGRVVGTRRRIRFLKRDIEDHHVLKNDDDTVVVIGNKKVITIDPFEEVDTMGGEDISLRYIPSLLTGTGIFGTFLGVSIALYSFPENINNSTEMLAGMKNLIPAMKTAFMTSLAGIFCATLFLFYEKIQLNNARRFVRKSLDSIRRDYHIQTPELHLQQHTKYLREQTECLKKQGVLDEAMVKMAGAAEGLQETVEKMQGGTSSEVLAELINNGLENSIEKYLTPPMAEIASRLTELEGVKNSSESIQENTQKLSYFITSELKGVFDALELSMNSSHAAMKETGAALIETNKVIENLNNNLDDFVKEMDATLTRQEDSFKNTVEGVRSNFKSTADTIATQYTKIHEDISGISGTFKTISTEFGDMIGTGQQAFSDQVQGFEKMLGEQQETSNTMFNEIRTLNEESMQGIIVTTKQTLESAVNQTRDNAVAMIEQAKGDIGEMGEKFKVVSSEFSQIIQDGNSAFKEQVEGFNAMLEGQRSLSEETFAEVRTLNQTSMEDIARTTQETINASVNKTRDTAIEMIEKSKADIDEMGKTFRTISGEFSTLVTEGNEAFGEQVTGFEKMLSDQRALSQDTFHEIRDLNKESLEGIVKTTKDTLGEAIAETRDSAVGMIEKARDSFESVVNETNQKLQGTLSGVGDALVNTSVRVQEELGKFRDEYTRSLDGFFDRQKDILEKILIENVEKLSGLTEQLKTVFEEEYLKQTDLIDRLGVVVAKGTTLNEMQKESMRELATETVDANRKIAGSLAKTSQKIESINDALKEIASVMSDEVASQIEMFCKKQNEVVNKYQVEVDGHLERVLGDMVSVSEILSSALLAVEGDAQ